MNKSIEHTPHDTHEGGGALDDSGVFETLGGRFEGAIEKLKGFPQRVQRYAYASLVVAGLAAFGAQNNEAQASMDTEPVGPSVGAEQTIDLETSLSPAERLARQQEYIGALQYALGSTESNNFDKNVNLALTELEQINVESILAEVATGASDLESFSPFTEPELANIKRSKDLLRVLKDIPENLLEHPDRIASLPSVEEIDRAYADAIRAHANERSAASSEQAVADEIAKLGELKSRWGEPVTPDSVELGGDSAIVGETPNFDGMTPDEIEQMAQELIKNANLAGEAGNDLSRFAEGTLEAQSSVASSESGLQESVAEIADVSQAETAEVPMHKTEEYKAYIDFINDTKNLADRFESGEISAHDAVEELRQLSQKARASFEFLIEKNNQPNATLSEAELERFNVLEQILHRSRTLKSQFDK